MAQDNTSRCLTTEELFINVITLCIFSLEGVRSLYFFQQKKLEETVSFGKFDIYILYEV